MKFDTEFNEEGHKPIKTAARLTQKKKDTFDEQTAIRLKEMHLLKLAEQEIMSRHP